MIFLRLFLGWMIQISPFAFLCIQPFTGHLRFPARKTMAVTVTLFAGLAAAFALAGCALYDTSSSNLRLSAAVNIVFMTTLIFCFLWYLYAVNASWPNKLFVFSYAMTGAFIITSISNMILIKLYSGRTDGLPYQGYTPLLLLLLTAVFLPIPFLILKRHYQIVKGGFTSKENIYLSALSIILCAAVSSGLLCLGYNNLYDPTTLFLYTALLISIFTMNGICFKILDIAYEKMNAQRKYDAVQRQLSLQAEQYRRLSNNMEATRRMSHDLRHHMITLQGFLQSGKIKQAEQYLDHYLLTTKEHEVTRLCDNAIVNAVVDYYRMLAEEQGVRFSACIAIPVDPAIQDVDLSVLIGNLLENAVDAVLLVNGDTRFICFNMICSGKMLVVAVDNGFNGTVKMEAGRYLSTKNQHSGFGLSSVEAIAEKYSGGVEFTHEADVFHSSVMLRMQSPLAPDRQTTESVR